MTNATLAPAVTLPVLSDDERATHRIRIRDTFPQAVGNEPDTYWRNTRTSRGLWTGASHSDMQLAQTPHDLLRGDWPSTAHAVDIWNEAHNELASRERTKLEAAEPVEWATISGETVAADRELNAEILSQFDGPIPDTKLAKLREIVRSERAATARVRQLEGQLINTHAQIDQKITDPNDDRVRDLFARAAVAADKKGYCGTYDEIAEFAGLPGRHEFTEAEKEDAASFFTSDYSVIVEHTVQLRVTVEATSEDDAIEQVANMSYADQWENADVDYNNVINESVIEAREE